MKKLIALTLLFFCFGTLWAQNQIQLFERLLKEEQFEELREVINGVDVEHPTVFYIKGLLTQEAYKSIHYYELASRHIESTFADDALFKIAQYYYSKGNYNLAKKYFSRIPKNWPESSLADDSIYLYAQCMVAAGSIDSAKLVLQRFSQQYSSSQYADLAVNDLESSLFPVTVPSHSVPDVSALKHSGSDYYYGIQVGAFKNLQNAQHQQRQFQRDGFSTEIYARLRNIGRVYVLVIGKYANRGFARRDAEKWKHKLGDYMIVEIDN